MKIAVVGATGLVGQKMLRILEERDFPVGELIPVASEKSLGKKIRFKGKDLTVISLDDALIRKPHIALFSAGGKVSEGWAPRFANKGIYVIDNSSAWRMHTDKKLIVPEINAAELTQEDKIIANPNCSTIQLVMALAPLHRIYGIRRLVISTYQSVSGSGVKALRQLENERAGIEGLKAYPHPIDLNCIPQCDIFADLGYTKEEWKLINETRKILGAPNIKITATAVRVPVTAGHSESVNVTFEKDFMLSDVRDLLNQTAGVIVEDSPMAGQYPMPLLAKDKDVVFVGRIRRDFSIKNGLNLWIVADNLRKGAATNAVQIAEYVLENFLLQK